MRIITGKYRGLRLISPEGDSIRPTSDRIKETLFNILQKYNIEGDVLDLFAGSGSLGIEALSRGAERVVFADSNSDSCRLIRTNLDKLKITNEAVLLQVDYLYAVKKLATEGQSFDIILADPPYNSMYEQKLLDAIAEYDILKEDGILVIEHDSGIMLGNNKFDMDLRKCGNTSLSFFQKR